MAYTSAQETKIKMYLGFSSLYLETYSKLESAISASEGTDTETEVIAILADIAAIEIKIENNYCKLAVIDAGAGKSKTSFDAVRATEYLKNLGRMKVKQLSILLENIEVVNDYFGQPNIKSSPSIYY